MPYLIKSRKEILDFGIDSILDNMGEETKIGFEAGDLTYCIYKLMKGYGAVRFVGFAIVIGATVLAISEYWWRIVRPYEDLKIKENGDV